MIGSLFARAVLFSRRVWRRLRMLALRPAFKRVGKNVLFDPDGSYSYGTIEIGDDVFIERGAVLKASESGIVIGSKVMLGPNVTILGGDHNTGEVGRFLFDVTNKRPQDDRVVVIEDDVWVGAGAIILKGVRLGRGCIVAAGAVVTRDVPPYTVAAGVPARVVKTRFDLETTLRHEEALYPPEKRLGRERLEEVFAGLDEVAASGT